MSLFRVLMATAVAAVIASPIYASETATQEPATTAAMLASDAADVKVNLNKATAKELMKVKGLNAPKARAIVAYRKKHGDFKSMDELMKVKGFKKVNQEKMEEISNQLTLD